jgi:hypothetical protein
MIGGMGSLGLSNLKSELAGWDGQASGPCQLIQNAVHCAVLVDSDETAATSGDAAVVHLVSPLADPVRRQDAEVRRT